VSGSGSFDIFIPCGAGSSLSLTAAAVTLFE